jgi:copper homeostasis protein
MEVCVDSFESTIAAFEGNANRIELCSSLNEGGLTPSIGLLKTVQNYIKKEEKKKEVNCMIRCRCGDFNYSDTEIETMIEDIKSFIELGVDGIVIGALTENVCLLFVLISSFLFLLLLLLKQTLI